MPRWPRRERADTRGKAGAFLASWLHLPLRRNRVNCVIRRQRKDEAGEDDMKDRGDPRSEPGRRRGMRETDDDARERAGHINATDPCEDATRARLRLLRTGADSQR